MVPFVQPSTPSESTVAPKSNVIRLGSAHEWSGVWIGPKLDIILEGISVAFQNG